MNRRLAIQSAIPAALVGASFVSTRVKQGKHLYSRNQYLAGTDLQRAQDVTFSVEEVIRMRCEPFGVPVIRGLMIGHVQDKTVVSIGIEAELNADAGTLQFLEPAVS